MSYWRLLLYVGRRLSDRACYQKGNRLFLKIKMDTFRYQILEVNIHYGSRRLSSRALITG